MKNHTVSIPTLLFICFLGFQLNLQAQSLHAYMPKTASVVISINGQGLAQKMGPGYLPQLEIFKDLDKDMTRSMRRRYDISKEDMPSLLSDPSKWGINEKATSHFFIEMPAANSDSYRYSVPRMAWIASISDIKKFEEFVLSTYGQKSEKGPEVIGGFKYLSVSRKRAMVWNNQMFIWTETDKPYRWDDEGESTDKSFAKQLINLKAHENLQNQPEFVKAQQSDYDLAIWLDSYQYNRYTLGSMFRMLHYPGGRFAEALQSLYENNFTFMTATFEQDRIKLESKSVMNDQLAKLSKDIVKAKVNPKFLRYMKEKNLMAYMAFAYNIEALVEGTEELFRPVIQDMPEIDRGIDGNVVVGFLDLMDIVINKERIYNLFKGDIMIALTDISEKEISYTSYEYDEDFNRVEVTKTKKQTVPEFLAMATLGGRDDIQTMLDWGTQSRLFKKEGNCYRIMVEDLNEFNLFLAINDDDILMFTNNQDLVQNHLNGGYSKSETLGKTHAKLLKGNSAFFWDMQKTFGALPFKEMRASRKEAEAFKILADNTGKFWIKDTGLKGNSYTATGYINFSNNSPDKNSVVHMVDLFNQMFIKFD